MGETTGISWTDATFNPWWGCTRVSPGCENCYAETFDKRVGGDHWGPNHPRRIMSEHYWNEPIRWNRKAEKAGKFLKVFCASMADIMDVEAPQGQRERLWELIDKTPYLIWQLLTKRPENYLRFLPSSGFANCNVWLGATTEDQKYFDLRWPFLLDAAIVYGTRAWISYEPALGPLRLWEHNRPNWVICGGESGNHRRAMEENWAIDLAAQCQARHIPFFMKQFSARTPAEGKLLIPDFLKIQEFPAHV